MSIIVHTTTKNWLHHHWTFRNDHVYVGSRTAHPHTTRTETRLVGLLKFSLYSVMEFVLQSRTLQRVRNFLLHFHLQRPVRKTSKPTNFYNYIHNVICFLFLIITTKNILGIIIGFDKTQLEQWNLHHYTTNNQSNWNYVAVGKTFLRNYKRKFKNPSQILYTIWVKSIITCNYNSFVCHFLYFYCRRLWIFDAYIWMLVKVLFQYLHLARLDKFTKS